MTKPIVLFSSLENTGNGDQAYNGGYKLQSIWAKLIRQHGYEAYRVTGDGTQVPWLIDPVPVLSYQAASKLARTGKPLRLMTTWIVADKALTLSERPYYFDAEIAHTSNCHHFAALKRVLPSLAKLGTHSRTQQAWYMATLGIAPMLIREWSDTALFVPAPEKRQQGLVGFMDEGPHTHDHLKLIALHCMAEGVKVRFEQVGGCEREVIDKMQACDVFLGMNTGKHSLWGEGCPRAAQEAMHCGALVLAYDVNGNAEYLIDDYTGYMVPRDDPGSMARRLVAIMRDRPQRETVRARGTDYVKHVFAPTEARWYQVKEFLDL